MQKNTTVSSFKTSEASIKIWSHSVREYMHSSYWKTWWHQQLERQTCSIKLCASSSSVLRDTVQSFVVQSFAYCHACLWPPQHYRNILLFLYHFHSMRLYFFFCVLSCSILHIVKGSLIQFSLLVSRLKSWEPT